MLGVSRKRFIGTLSGVVDARDRTHGSVAAGLAGLAQGVQFLRVHDVAETRQALEVWQAIARQK
jgi:dihydropteroate synthase